MGRNPGGRDADSEPETTTEIDNGAEMNNEQTPVVKNPAAVALAKMSWASGKVSDARRVAARANGRKGRRPKRQPTGVIETTAHAPALSGG